MSLNFSALFKTQCNFRQFWCFDLQALNCWILELQTCTCRSSFRALFLNFINIDEFYGWSINWKFLVPLVQLMACIFLSERMKFTLIRNIQYKFSVWLIVKRMCGYEIVSNLILLLFALMHYFSMYLHVLQKYMNNLWIFNS